MGGLLMEIVEGRGGKKGARTRGSAEVEVYRLRVRGDSWDLGLPGRAGTKPGHGRWVVRYNAFLDNL